MPDFLSTETWVSFLSLSAMEIVLGIDNIVFISILSSRLPHPLRSKARVLGLGVALGLRMALLFSINLVLGLKTVLLTWGGLEITGRHLVLFAGGAFLVGKATYEIFHTVESAEPEQERDVSTSFRWTVGQIILIDLVFSLDSVVTAVGMVRDLSIMIAAMLVAVGVMILFSRSISDFVHAHPSVKVLALAFLLLVGVILVAEALGQHLSRSIVYTAMAFSLFVELLNMRMRQNRIRRATAR